MLVAHDAVTCACHLAVAVAGSGAGAVLFVPWLLLLLHLGVQDWCRYSPGLWAAGRLTALSPLGAVLLLKMLVATHQRCQCILLAFCVPVSCLGISRCLLLCFVTSCHLLSLLLCTSYIS